MRLTIKRKLIGSAILLSLAVVILGVVSILAMNDAHDDMVRATQSANTLYRLVIPIKNNLHQLQSHGMEYLLLAGQGSRENTIRDHIRKTSDSIDSDIASLQAIDLSSARVPAEVRSSINELSTSFQRYKAGFSRIDQAQRDGGRLPPEALNRMLASQKTSFNDLIQEVDVIEEAGKAVQNQNTAQGISTLESNRLMVAVIAILIALMVPLMNMMTSRSIRIPIDRIMQFVRNFSKGDLSSRLPMGKPINCAQIMDCGKDTCSCFGHDSYCWVEAGMFSNYPTCPKVLSGGSCLDCGVFKKGVSNEFEEVGSSINALADELVLKAQAADGIAKGNLKQTIHVASSQDVLGKSLESMVQYLNNVLVEVKETSDLVAGGAHQVSDSSMSLSQGATEQAASLEEIESSMAEVSSQTRHNAENSSAANELSLMAREAAEKGNTRMQSMVEAMGGISSSSKEIANIIKTIDEIAFQTNLLALNAAVEAARAGKHGKGFAVVAQEVRNLAGRSAKAAGETAELIEKSVNSVENGSAIVSETAKALEEITEAATKTADLIGEIAAASNEQAKGITQIDLGLKQIEKVTQQNTANAEETSAASEELASQAKNLNRMMAHFILKSERRLTAETQTPVSAHASIPKIEAHSAQIGWGEPNAPAALPETTPAPDSSQLIQWSSSFSVGVAEIDRQHQDLVRYINTLYNALRKGKGQDALYDTIMNLIGYTKLHFATEEKYFDQFGYSETAAHKKEHEKLIAQVLEYKEKIDNGQAAVSVKLIDFLKNWLLNHIQKTDKKYGPFFNQHGLK